MVRATFPLRDNFQDPIKLIKLSDWKSVNPNNVYPGVSFVSLDSDKVNNPTFSRTRKKRLNIISKSRTCLEVRVFIGIAVFMC